MFHEVWNKMCLRAIINMQLYIMNLNKYSVHSKLLSPCKTSHETDGLGPIIWEVMGEIYRASSGWREIISHVLPFRTTRILRTSYLYYCFLDVYTTRKQSSHQF